MVVKATCPKCKRVIYGYQWAKTKSNKNWLMNEAGDWHSCGDQVEKKSKYPIMDEKAVYKPKYYSCGKCGNNLEEIPDNRFMSSFYTIPRPHTFGWWCNDCDMFPQVSNRRMDETGGGPKDPSVKAYAKSNRDDIITELRNVKMEDSEKVVREGGNRQSGEKPLNWMCMNEDGTIKNGWKLTSELTEWFNNGGSEVIKELNKRTILTKVERPVA